MLNMIKANSVSTSFSKKSKAPKAFSIDIETSLSLRISRGLGDVDSVSLNYMCCMEYVNI